MNTKKAPGTLSDQSTGQKAPEALYSKNAAEVAVSRDGVRPTLDRLSQPLP